MTQKKKAPAQYSSLTGIHRAVPIILFAVAVFTLFCFITQDIGSLGRAISTVFLGLFSSGAYAIPLLLSLHAIFYPSDISEKRVLSRVIFSLIAITFISALTHSITYWGEELTFNVGEFFKNGQASVGGGFIGGIVGFCLVKVFGRVGLVIIAAAILAIYVSYFFARGQKGISRVLFGILKGIVIVLAFIERQIKTLFGTVKNAKSEKMRREREQKNVELTDDDFFAVDNGMQRLSVSELGIQETRREEDIEGNPTLHEKVFFKSALSREEAEEMEMREKAEEMFFSMSDDEPVEEEAPAPRRRLVNVSYDDPDSKIGRSPVKEEAPPAPVFAEPVPTKERDDSASSIFTQDFDPFSMVMSEQLASKPSSRSLLDESPRKTVVNEDISELTEADIERDKQRLEFERRKAALLNARRAIPVENDGEFVGNQKTVEFHERSDESLSQLAVETESSSFIFDKAEKTAEPPKAAPANYTAIGFGSDVSVPSYTQQTPAFTAPETIYSYDPPAEEKPKTTPQSAPSSYFTIPSSVPYVEEEETKFIFEGKGERAETTIHTPPADTYNPTREPEGERAAEAPSYNREPTAHVYESSPEVAENDENGNIYSAAAEAPSQLTVNESPSHDEEGAVSSFFMGDVNTDEKKDDTPFTYTSTSGFDDEEENEEYSPEFKPYNPTVIEEIAADAESEEIPDEEETASTLKIEREYINDESEDPTDEYAEEEYEEEDEDEEDEEEDLSEFEPDGDDGDGSEEDEIPPEERNPVVQGYKDMFSALRDDEPEEEEEDHSHDYEPISPDEADEYDDNYDDDEDYDTPPFDVSPAKPETKAKAEKKEEKPAKKKPDFSHYKMPSIDLLGLDPATDDDKSEINENTKILIDTLASFNVTASIKGVDRGPRITRYEVVPARGVKVNAITNLFNDIKLNLAKEGIRMEAPIPGKSAIGFEIPNKKAKNVRLRELIECEEFGAASSKTHVAIGKDVAGNPIFGDIAKYPHALICGATGMGKSVCINSILVSMLYKARPDEVKLIMIDPKKVEFRMYSGIPHLLIPVITEAKQAAGALMWAVEEMERRYELIETHNVRNIEAYNEKVNFNPSIGDPLPKIIIVIDELADLMMQVRDPAEDLIMRIAQKARAAGIHLLIGTQRPSVQIITGAIKANIPSRISCKVTSQVDSRTIFDMKGAEELLSRGDMLYWPVDRSAALRVQGAFVSDREVEDVMEFLKSQVTEGVYDDEVFEEINKAAQKCGNKKSGGVSADDIDDDGEDCGYYSDQQFLDAVELAIRSKKVSTSLLQRKLSIGYGKAAKYIDAMEEIGIVSEPKGQKPRDVLLSMDEWHEKLSRVDLG